MTYCYYILVCWIDNTLWWGRNFECVCLHNQVPGISSGHYEQCKVGIIKVLKVYVIVQGAISFDGPKKYHAQNWVHKDEKQEKAPDIGKWVQGYYECIED